MRSIPALLLLLLLPAAAAAKDRERAGFFFRGALGAGTLDMKREGSIDIGSSAYYTGDSRIRGGAGALELTLGGTFPSGFVLAGTFMAHSHGDPVLEKSGEDVKLEGNLGFALLGITGIWFPDLRGGFHLGLTAALAGAWVKTPPPRLTEYLGGGGGALSLEVGYLWWIGQEWSLGVLGRLTGARLHGEDTQLGVTGSEDDSVGAITLLLDIAYH